jgi:acetoacetyl-CoA synthetase
MSVPTTSLERPAARSEAGKTGGPIWIPDPGRASCARLTAFARAAQRYGAPATVRSDGSLDYGTLHAWSVANRAAFWTALWEFCEVVADGAPRRGHPEDAGIGLDRMAPPDPVAGPRWFPRARLNYAENLLRHHDDRPALIAWSERGRERTLTHAELACEAARFAAGLRALGVGPGDRVAGYLPNVPETVIAMLGTAAVGAVWSSCSPDFGVRAVVDRFGQIEPRVLVCADAYRYGGKVHDRLDRAREIAGRLPTLERVVLMTNPAGGREPGEGERAARTIAPIAIPWEAFLGPNGSALDPVRLPFDHPLFIMYSSGTTGLPKGMVHGAGGTLLQHLKELVLHTDLGPADRIFYFTTCGWMMWNWLVTSLAVGATVVLYDGAPLAPSPARGDPFELPHPDILWTMAATERVTVFGTSAKYLALAEKEHLTPRETHDLSALRAVLSTGSPLAAHSFDYVYERVKGDVHLASISGGTDIISCFVLGNPTAPVWRGEIQAPGLGMAVEVWSPSGERVTGAPGELVCTAPFPSMPVSFWNDPDGAKYHAAYFETFPGVWRHGDWIEETAHGGYIIHGRSDATLNPSGVRIGTAEIYRQVEQLPEVVESLAIGQEVDGDVRIVLFVRLAPGLGLDDALRERIRRQIREHTSPHHVPRVILQVADLPRTISGKVSELAVREVVHGRPVKNLDALANPEALEHFRNRPELAS